MLTIEHIEDEGHERIIRVHNYKREYQTPGIVMLHNVTHDPHLVFK